MNFKKNLHTSNSSDIKEKTESVEELNEKELLSRAEQSFQTLHDLLKSEEKKAKKLRISFYFGGPGLYLNGCLLSFLKKDKTAFKQNLQDLLSYKSIILNSPDKFYKEILYGVSGYLHCLLKLQSLFQDHPDASDFHTDLSEHVTELVELIVNDGIRSYDPDGVDLKELPHDFRLVYDFHEREYLGGAHGLFGVLYTLLRAYQLNNDYFAKEKDGKFLITVKASLELLIKYQRKNGNFPTRFVEKGHDDAVQFCHGSPGAIHCLLLASKIFKGEDIGTKCLNAAVLAGENIWEYGILKKGFGLCHGISGNGYGLLELYKETDDKNWLYRAYCFALLKKDKHYTDEIAAYDFSDRFTTGISDYPFSLMLGLSGDICYYADCLFPENAR